MDKIIIVDDHKIFRQGLKSLIVNERMAEVVAEASNGKEFLDILPKHKPDLVLMDIEMPEMNGVEATREALSKNPDLRVLVLSTFGDEIHYYNIIQAGAKGFVLKSSGIKELQTAIKEVAAGESYFSNELLRRIIANVGASTKEEAPEASTNEKLSKRELEILQHIANGLSNEEISEKLHISHTTVKGHRSSILNKTGSKNTASLIIHAIKNNLIVIN